MVRMSAGRNMLSSVCMAALSAVAIGCKNNKVVAQPPVVHPPAPTAVSRPRQRQPSLTPTAPPPATSSVPSSNPAAPQPRLGQIVSPAEERAFNSAIDQSLTSARSSLNAIAGRTLSREQSGVVLQIKDFMQQAELVRDTDLLAARGLADKADVLARDLLRSVR